jgi:hypothetical protein
MERMTFTYSTHDADCHFDTTADVTGDAVFLETAVQAFVTFLKGAGYAITDLDIVHDDCDPDLNFGGTDE